MSLLNVTINHRMKSIRKCTIITDEAFYDASAYRYILTGMLKSVG